MLIHVEGRPVPQGSMTASYNRKEGVAHVHHVQGTALAVWRASIREECKRRGYTDPPVTPVSVKITFAMPRPREHMVLQRGRYVVKASYLWRVPTSPPDLDKLIRGVLDALTGMAYHDDSQVVEVYARKVYASGEPYAIIEVTDSRSTDQYTQDALGLGETKEADPSEGQGSLWSMRGEGGNER